MTQFGNCLYSNAEIQRFFITTWTTDVIAYFDTDSVITSLTGLTAGWDEIELKTASVSYNQTLNPPNPNGINYTETATVLAPHSDIAGWLDLVDILSDRFIIIFQDGNDNWFVLGWRFGTKAEGYTLEENQYSLNFINAFSTNLLTAISESYVNSYVL